KTFYLDYCLAPAPSPSRRFDPPDEAKERLHWSALQRLSGLNDALALFVLLNSVLKNPFFLEAN
ncbi:hypothetical protein, partial [Mesobacillus boroniphilus]|uniref:hypothetical protein n=1 Tax=Mesobacillus boroniphilus TaxID=308892 RepID=UPI000AF90C3F